MNRLRDFLLPRIGRTPTAIALTAIGFAAVGVGIGILGLEILLLAVLVGDGATAGALAVLLNVGAVIFLYITIEVRDRLPERKSKDDEP